MEEKTDPLAPDALTALINELAQKFGAPDHVHVSFSTPRAAINITIHRIEPEESEDTE